MPVPPPASQPAGRWLRALLASPAHPPVAQALGYYVALPAPAQAPGLPRDPEARLVRTLGWAISGDLTWSDAETLLALDETTDWLVPA